MDAIAEEMGALAAEVGRAEKDAAPEVIASALNFGSSSRIDNHLSPSPEVGSLATTGVVNKSLGV